MLLILYGIVLYWTCLLSFVRMGGLNAMRIGVGGGRGKVFNCRFYCHRLEFREKDFL